MTNIAGGENAKAGREDVLELYGAFYSRVWGEGSVKVCEDTQLMEQARQAVLTQCEAAHTFTLLPFYPTVIDIINTSINTTNTSSTSVLQRLSKAFEVLELLCVNLFLFPWKKEIKTLKKFTGHYVYYIKAVLPLQTTRSVLHHIGYDSETDTEYKLSNNVDPNRAKEMGFELFLARIECEHLIQMTSQTPHAECLEIIQNRGSAAILQDQPELCNTPNGVLEEDRAHRDDDCLLNPDLSLKPLHVEVNERQNSKRGSFLSEDKSILEMQKDYPDLAFRQRPIFKRSSAKLMRSEGRDVKFGRETSDPRPITLHAEAPEPALDPCSSEEQELRVGAVSHTPGLKHDEDASVTDLAEMMEMKLKLKEFPSEEPLKCPVEETAQCEKNKSICNIAGCSSSSTSDRLQQHHGITEPPQSFYIPNCVSGSAPAPPAEQEENIHPSSRAGTEPVLHHALEI